MKFHFYGLDHGLANFFSKEPDNWGFLDHMHMDFVAYSLFS